LESLTSKGNHDEYLLNFWKQKQLGIEVNLKSSHQGIAEALSEKEWQYIESLPYWITIPEQKIIVVHAGLVPGVQLEKQKLFDLTHMRNITNGEASEDGKVGTAWTDHWNGPDLIIYGHDAMRGLCVRDHSIGLDTGCCYGDKLTAFIYPSKEIVQVNAKMQYAQKTNV
jgi:hypothetical protein